MFFAKSHLTLQQLMVLMYWWACQYPVTNAAQGSGKVEKNTGVQAYQYFRDIWSWHLLNHDAPLMLGGPSGVVHIDQSPFRYKPKVWYSCMGSSFSDCQHPYYNILEGVHVAEGHGSTASTALANLGQDIFLKYPFKILCCPM